MPDKKKILICPLDWGLGHATRCIPIIKSILDHGHIPLIAADSRPLDLLKQEFPEIQTIRLPGYGITYPRNGLMILRMAMQTPSIFLGIWKENLAVRKIVKEHQIDLLISDNRFGLWHRDIPCVYMAHQILIKCPQRFEWLEPLLHFIHKTLAEKYTECWIPDLEGERSLAFDLTGKFEPPGNSRFIGLLSRFERLEDNENSLDLLVILSGPEPQRSIFEGIILEQLEGTTRKTLVVQGKTENEESRQLSENVRIVSYLTGAELNKMIMAADVVLARPGYSTIMDLAVTGKKAILTPTPGQTEQEYLAGEYAKRKLFYCTEQAGFNLNDALQKVAEFSGVQRINYKTSELFSYISELLK